MKKQRICIVGDGLSGLMTAIALNKLKGLEVHLISRKNKHSKDRRTTAISASNYEFFNHIIGKLDKKLFWPSKRIDLFYEIKDKNMNFLNFKEDTKNLMYVFENDKTFQNSSSNQEKNQNKNSKINMLKLEQSKSLNKTSSNIPPPIPEKNQPEIESIINNDE